MGFTVNLNSGIAADKSPIYLYDMSIEDLDERREKRLEFPSVTKASNFLGYDSGVLSERIKKRQYVYKRDTREKYAARYVDNKNNKP